MDDGKGDLPLASRLQNGEDESTRVLVVDDVGDQADTIAMLLRLSGYGARSAHRADQALALAREYQPHVAVIDLKMPWVDGYQLARELRRHPATQGTILIALTGLINAKDRALAAGFDHYMLKPLALEQLLSLFDGPERDSRGADRVALSAARPDGIILRCANDESDTGAPAR